jgi:5,5'-dehydrodivanillate O-demethylase
MMMQMVKDEKGRKDAAYTYRPIQSIDFELCKEPNWAGIRKIRIYGGENGEREAGHPSLFPTSLLVPQGKDLVIHFKTPVDDTHFYGIWLEFTPNPDGSTVEQADADIPVSYFPNPRDEKGDYELTSFIGQDMMAFESQGRLFDRPNALIGSSDRGVLMFRNLLKEQIKVVQEGGTPAGVFYDPALNDIIRFVIHDGQARMARKMEAAAE